MEDHELHQASEALDSGYWLLKFPPELEKQYIRHYEQTRLITSGRLVATGLAVFILFVFLDYIVFPFNAALCAWLIRGATALVIAAAVLLSRYSAGGKMGFGAVSALAFIINAAVVAIDVIGANTAGYTLTLGSLFVIIAACTLVRFPFWISLVLVLSMAATQLAGMLLFMHMSAMHILNNVLFYIFIIAMLLVSSFTSDADSRRIFLLNIYRKKYEKSGLSSSTADQYGAQLEAYMQSGRPYLNPDLRIEDVAAALNIKRHHLTQIINEKYGKNFFAYINAFRVADAQRMLADSGSRDMTVLRIAYETGFNSKATFNRIFKQMIGVSPSEYKHQPDAEKLRRG